jgi:signal transduction histidine kinase
MIWSMLANIGAYVGVSLIATPSAEEHRQASVFVDAFREAGGARFWRGTASLPDLYNLLARFPRRRGGGDAFRQYAAAKGRRWPEERSRWTRSWCTFVEVQLAGAIGAASARVMVASVAKEEALTLEEVRAIVDDASQAVMYSHRLEQKSRELEAATAGCAPPTSGCRSSTGLKDDFVSMVSHELRTPLTSIRAFTQILFEDPEVELEQRKKFLGIITKETERLTRLINQVLDVSKMESGRADWQAARVT